MVFLGRVIGGAYVNSSVDFNRRGDLIVELTKMGQAVFKSRKINRSEVAAWEEVVPTPRSGAVRFVGSVGQAVAGAALPGVLGKSASAAVGAGVDAATRQRHVRIDWADGEQSLLRLPEKYFTHLAVLLDDLRVQAAASTELMSAQDEFLDPTGQVLQQTGQILGQVAGLIQDRRSAANEHAVAALEADSNTDLTEQIVKLAALRDQGILTEAEFAAKKTELLGRL